MINTIILNVTSCQIQKFLVDFVPFLIAYFFHKSFELIQSGISYYFYVLSHWHGNKPMYTERVIRRFDLYLEDKEDR